MIIKEPVGAEDIKIPFLLRETGLMMFLGDNAGLFHMFKEEKVQDCGLEQVTRTHTLSQRWSSVVFLDYACGM